MDGPSDLDAGFMGHPVIGSIIKDFDDDTKKQVFEEYHKIMWSIYGPETSEVMNFDGITVIAQK